MLGAEGMTIGGRLCSVRHVTCCNEYEASCLNNEHKVLQISQPVKAATTEEVDKNTGIA